MEIHPRGLKRKPWGRRPTHTHAHTHARAGARIHTDTHALADAQPSVRIPGRFEVQISARERSHLWARKGHYEPPQTQEFFQTPRVQLRGGENRDTRTNRRSHLPLVHSRPHHHHHAQPPERPDVGGRFSSAPAPEFAGKVSRELSCRPRPWAHGCPLTLPARMRAAGLLVSPGLRFRPRALRRRVLTAPSGHPGFAPRLPTAPGSERGRERGASTARRIPPPSLAPRRLEPPPPLPLPLPPPPALHRLFGARRL